MHVLFIEPSFPNNQREFVRALHAVGARVTGIGEVPVESVPGQIKEWLYGYEQVSNVCSERALLEAVQRVQRREWVDRLEATVEAHILTAAKVREASGIPGTRVKTAYLCRDKPAMKEALRQAGVPCAQSIGTDSPDEIRDFVRSVGFPVILKPRDAAGAAGTWKARTSEELEGALRESGATQGRSIAVEEFIEGHEAFYDTLCIDGQISHEFITHYYPGVLEAMRNRWVSPGFITTNRVGVESYDDVKAMGKKVIEVLGIGTSATHMEWFFGPKGLKFSEIGCRPPGVGAWDLYCAANEMDLYREWAAAIAHGHTLERPSRRYSAGILNLRPDRDGRIVRYEGWEAVERRYGEWILDTHLPPPGSRTQPVEAGYMANAWIRLRHPDYDTLREILDNIGKVLKVRAG